MASSGIILFGGTFDPPHRAHAALPPLAAEALGCDRLIYIPAAINPLKTDAPPASALHRLAMLEIATADISIASISTVELERDGPSYFVDTAAHFRERTPAGTPLRFLIGSDQAASFHRWKDWRRILELAEPAVMIRPPVDRDAMLRAIEDSPAASLHEFWDAHLLKLPLIDTSSTDVRRLLERGDVPGELLDPRVAAYIEAHDLYRTSA